MSRICSERGKSLEDEPSILINEASYCFFHAKRTHPKFINLHQRREEELNVGHKERCKAYEAAKKFHEEKRKAREQQRISYVFSGGLHGKKRYVYGVVVLLCWVAKPVIGFLSLFVLPFILWGIEELVDEPRYKEFDRKCPPLSLFEGMSPEYKSLPIVTLESDPTNEPSGFASGGYNRVAVLKRDEFVCQCCGKRFQEELLEVHHVHPRSSGGFNHIRNLVALCVKCHMDESWFGHVHKKAVDYGRRKRARL